MSHASRSPRRRPPGARLLAAAALACIVAVFGVLALRVRAGEDPALGAPRAKASVPPIAVAVPSAAADPAAAPPADAGGWSSVPTTRAS